MLTKGVAPECWVSSRRRDNSSDTTTKGDSVSPQNLQSFLFCFVFVF